MCRATPIGNPVTAEALGLLAHSGTVLAAGTGLFVFVCLVKNAALQSWRDGELVYQTFPA